MIYNHVKSKVVTSYVGPGLKEVGSGIRLPVSGMKAMGSGITGKIPGSIPLWTYRKRTSNPESCLTVTSHTCQTTILNWPGSS